MMVPAIAAKDTSSRSPNSMTKDWAFVTVVTIHNTKKHRPKSEGRINKLLKKAQAEKNPIKRDKLLKRVDEATAKLEYDKTRRHRHGVHPNGTVSAIFEVKGQRRNVILRCEEVETEYRDPFLSATKRGAVNAAAKALNIWDVGQPYRHRHELMIDMAPIGSSSKMVWHCTPAMLKGFIEPEAAAKAPKKARAAEVALSRMQYYIR